jgi:hypothetical protein
VVDACDTMVFRGQDLWRRHPIFKWKVTDALPGLREGAAAFGVYVAAEWVYKKLYADLEDNHYSHSDAGKGHDNHKPAAGAGH